MDQLSPPRTTASISFALLVRDTLLQRSLPTTLESPTDVLRQRLYRAAVALVPPSPTAQRGTGAPAHRTDEALLADFLHGDASAFEGLMAQHLKWMHNWSRRHLPPHEADDAVQEAFIALLQKARDLQLRVPLRSYLFGLLRIAVLRALRSISRRDEPLADERLDTLALAATNEGPEAALLTQRSHAELAEALSRACTLREQEVILFTLEGQDDRTIASALEIKEGNVRVLRHRAMGKLRQALATPTVPERRGGEDEH
jgi:RNA polymerase sigma-70 factor (ECF subfamily)